MEKETSKKDVLQLEKRVIDMELLATELKETAKDLSLIPEFKQRLDDVEDLVMVENAGVIELKGMLEKFVPPEIKLPENLDERLKLIEEKIQGLPDFSELETRIRSSIPAGFPELETKIKNLETGVSQLNEKLTTAPDFSQIESRIKNSVLTSLPDLMQLENKIKDSVSMILPDLQRIKDDVNKRLEDIELKKQEIEKRLSGEVSEIKKNISKELEDIGLKGQKIEKLAGEIDEKLKVSVRERVEREFERVRDDWLAYSEKVNSVEKFVKEFSKKIDDIEPILKKLNSFERILDLDKRTSEKLQEFSTVSENLEKLAERSTVIFGEIDKRMQKLDVLEKELPSVQKNLSNVSEEVEKIKVGFLKKEEVIPLVTNFKLMADDYKSFVEDISKRTVGLQIGLGKRLKPIEESITTVRKTDEELKNLIESMDKTLTSTLESNLSAIENKRIALEKRVDETWKSIPSLISSQVQTINKKLETLESDTRPLVSGLDKKIGEIENKLKDIRVEEIGKKISIVENKLKETKIEEMDKILGNVNSKLTEFESKIGALENKYRKIEGMGEVRTQPTFFDEGVRDLLSRMVFLESRLVAIEGSMQKASMALPIVIE